MTAGQDHLTTSPPHHLGHVQAVQSHFPCLLGAAGEQELLPAVANAVGGNVLIEAPWVEKHPGSWSVARRWILLILPAGGVVGRLPLACARPSPS